MKRPCTHKEIVGAIRFAEISGGGEFTAYHGAKAWDVSPKTARAWLNLWLEMGYVSTRPSLHRSNVGKMLWFMEAQLKDLVVEGEERERDWADRILHY